MVTYSREVLHRSAGCEVIRFVWAPGTQTCAHDHGRARGVEVACRVFVVSGRIFEERPMSGRSVYGPGWVISLDQDVVHTVGCEGGEPAVTIHVYTSDCIDPALGMSDIATRL